MFATGVECSYPTLDQGRWRFDEMAACGHYRHWRADLALVCELGLRYLRYGPPLHLINPRRGYFDWTFLDDVAAEMQRLGITPIMDLCHFGLPDWLENFQNPETPDALAAYARAFALRYGWVRFYTPVTATRHLARASVLMMQAIAAVRPNAVFINSESSEFFQPCCPDPKVRQTADFENQRRFLALDLLYATGMRDDMRAYLLQNGMPAEEYAWFMQQDIGARAILGLDYYEWNESSSIRKETSRRSESCSAGSSSPVSITRAIGGR